MLDLETLVCATVTAIVGGKAIRALVASRRPAFPSELTIDPSNQVQDEGTPSEEGSESTSPNASTDSQQSTSSDLSEYFTPEAPSPENDYFDIGSEDAENQSSELQGFFELFIQCSLDKYSPFYNVDMKKLIQTLVRQSGPDTFRYLLRLLPHNGKAQELGLAFFDDSNNDFWLTVAQWEKKLRAGDFKIPKHTPPTLPFKDDAYLSYWEARVKNMAHSKARKELRAIQSDRTKVLSLYGKKSKITKNYKKRVNTQLR